MPYIRPYVRPYVSIRLAKPYTLTPYIASKEMIGRRLKLKWYIDSKGFEIDESGGRARWLTAKVIECGEGELHKIKYDCDGDTECISLVNADRDWELVE